MKYLILLLTLGITTSSFSQKNTISIEHSTILSKLLIEKSIATYNDTHTGGVFSYLYPQAEINQPLITNSIRYSYKRKIGEKFKVGIWGRRLFRGIKNHYSYNLLPDGVPFNISDTYGGFSLIFRMKSYETGLSLDYQVFTNKSLSFDIGINPALDVFDLLKVNDNSLKRDYGFVFITGNEQRYANSGRMKFWERYSYGIQNDWYRMSLYLSGTIDYKTIIKGLSLNCSINIGGSTPLKTEEQTTLIFLPDGWIVLGSIEFGLSYSF